MVDDSDPAGGAEDERNYCSLPAVPPREFPAGTDPQRAAAVLVNESKWVSGTTLRYYFFDRDTDGESVTFTDGTSEFRTWTTDEAHMDLVREAFQQWKDLGIGLDFLEVDERSEAEIRIGFMQGDGSWSYLGRQVLDRGSSERTMNFGWPLVDRPDGVDTALHEIGHTLGLPHEHQNPNAGIVWDEEEVYRRLAAPPNRWSRDTTFWNIIRKLAPDSVQGSTWDPDSVMHYPFSAGMILQPEKYRTQPLEPAGGLSPRDRTWVRTFYPPTDDDRLEELVPFRSVPLELKPSGQRDFAMLPDATREYRIQTFGAADTVVVVFEEVDGVLRFLAGDDDSGQDRNASLKLKLFKGKRYVVRIRLYFAWSSGETAIMLW